MADWMPRCIAMLGEVKVGLRFEPGGSRQVNGGNGGGNDNVVRVA
jgi:hypothetical protein